MHVLMWAEDQSMERLSTTRLYLLLHMSMLGPTLHARFTPPLLLPSILQSQLMQMAFYLQFLTPELLTVCYPSSG